MASEGPTKSDIQAIFKKLRSIPTNKQCFDCGAINPTWASVTYGVFLCIDCSATHRSLGVHVTFIRSTQLDTNWTWLQLRAMQIGGNATATAFFRQHGCISNDSQQKYHSRAAQMYREKLHALAFKAMKTHGTKFFYEKDGKLRLIHLDSQHPEATSPSPVTKEVDFFKEHVSDVGEMGEGFATNVSNGAATSVAQPVPISNGSLTTAKEVDPSEGPNVDHALSTSPTTAQQVAEPRKATIGGRKPTGAKKGFGGKKGMGAQKVQANFSEIESQALQRDKDREQLEKMHAQQETRTKEDQVKQMASMKLAYKDLSLEEKKRGEKMKSADPKKKEQMERLGMGFGGSRGASHSVVTDMQTIEQETPNLTSSGSQGRFNTRATNDYEDDFEIIGGFSSGPPKYNENPFGLKGEDRYSNNWGSSSSGGGGGSGSKPSWESADRFEKKQSSEVIEDMSSSSKPSNDDKGRSRKTYETSSSDSAQKKFGNAKAISSDAYFGNKDPDFDTQQKLNRFQGSSSISSAELFGNGQQTSRPKNDYGGAGPDLSEIKEGVRQGVTKVAGKLSSLANGVINSIQRN